MEAVIAAGLLLPDLTRSVAEEHLDELEKLIETAGGNVVGKVLARRPAPDPATFVGKGKAEEIKAIAAHHDAGLVVFDDDLGPAQVRNLEKIIGTKVIDRSGLILDIFAGRARSREARTQVELAQLEYMLPRLAKAWSHLERQAGGIGTRGVGETQLELDRRIVRTRIVGFNVINFDYEVLMGYTILDLPHQCRTLDLMVDIETKLGHRLGLDSVDVVSIVSQVERRFRIRLGQQELEKLVTAGDVLDLLQAKLAEAASKAA